jgi:thymidine kinase
MVCGNPANHTQRLVPSGDRVLLGTQGTYEARCRACFDPNLERAAAVGEPKAAKEPRTSESRIPNPEPPKR